MKLATDCFEFLYDGLGQFALKIGIAFAAEDSTAGKTIRINGAFTPLLIGTSAEALLKYFGFEIVRKKVKAKTKKAGEK